MNYKSYLVEQNINLLSDKIVLFYGENVGLKEDFKYQIKENNKEIRIINYNQEDILKNEEFFNNEINNLSLFEEKKIYFINCVNDKLLNIIKNIKTNSNNEYFFFSEILDKKSKIRNFFETTEQAGVVACYADNDITFKKKILEKLKGFRGLSPENINIINESCNLDRIKLNNEIDKIIIFFNNKIIEKDSLELLLNTTVNNNFVFLRDEVLVGNKNQANKLIADTVIEPDKNILYLNMINQRLIKLSDIAERTKSTDLESAVNSIRPPIFWKDKPMVMVQAKKWSSNKIRKILNETYSLELKMKSNSMINHNILLKKLLVDICCLANVS